MRLNRSPGLEADVFARPHGQKSHNNGQPATDIWAGPKPSETALELASVASISLGVFAQRRKRQGPKYPYRSDHCGDC